MPWPGRAGGLIIRALLQDYLYHGDNFKVACPTGSGKLMNRFEVARDIGSRLTRILVRHQHGRRPVYGDTEKFQTDPHWRDYILSTSTSTGNNGTDWVPAIRRYGPGWSPA